MTDIVPTIRAYLYAQWTATNPAKASIKFRPEATYAPDRTFDENAQSSISAGTGHKYPQILVSDEVDCNTTLNFVTDEVLKIEHEVKITLYLRPVNHMPDTIAALYTTFENTKKEIMRILKLGRYSINGISFLDFGKWKNEVPRKKDPIFYNASMIVKCTYFDTEA